MVELSACENDSKIDCCLFLGIPIPVSRTENVTFNSLSLPSIGLASILNSISPLSVNLDALPNKLIST